MFVEATRLQECVASEKVEAARVPVIIKLIAYFRTRHNKAILLLGCYQKSTQI